MNVQSGPDPENGETNPMVHSRRCAPKLTMALALVAATAVGAVGFWGVSSLTSSTPTTNTGTTQLSAATAVTKTEPVRAEEMSMGSSHQSTRVKRSFLRNTGLPNVYAPVSARTVVKDFNGNTPWFTITYDVVTGVPFGRFTDANATMDGRRLMLRIHNHVTDKTGFLFPQDFSTKPNASMFQLAFFVGPSGAFGVVHTSERGDVHLAGPGGKAEWESFFVPAMWGLTGALFDEQIERGLLTEADARAAGRRLSWSGDAGRWIGNKIGGWAGDHAGTWAGSKVGRWAGDEAGEWAGGVAGGAIGAAVGGPVGADIGEAVGSDVGRWAGGEAGGWIGGKIGGSWGRDAGSDFGGDIGEDAGNAW